MQFEHFDNKIREAADHHHPAYDEKAWEKMEKLLDRHLPQKKDDRRRIIFFLLLFVLLGGGTWFLIGRPGHSDKTISKADQKEQSANITSTTNNKPISSEKDKISLAPNTSTINEGSQKNLQQKKNEDKTTTTFDRNKYTQSVVSMINDRLKKSVQKNSASEKNKNSGNKKQPVSSDISNSVSEEETVSKPSKEIAETKMVTQNQITSGNNNNTEKRKTNIDTNPDSPKAKATTESVNENKTADKDKKDVAKSRVADSNPKKTSTKNKKSNYFFLSISAGPDVSAAGINSIGKVKPIYGIGIGFSFQSKFSLSTGFYSARKIYTASPDEYHPPYNFWSYYPYLKKVDANCRVFEIPLMVSYNFTHSKKHSIFGTAGLSSYFMKQETYNYISKLPSGQTSEWKQTYNNKNKHYFSVVTLSGGYQRHLSNSVSLAVEPYVKIPVDGIGFGKVQLNSAGMLFSVLVKPFKERKEK